MLLMLRSRSWIINLGWQLVTQKFKMLKLSCVSACMKTPVTMERLSSIGRAYFWSDVRCDVVILWTMQ